MTRGAEQAMVVDLGQTQLQGAGARIAAAANTVGRAPAAVTLVAVSKAQPDERVGVALGGARLQT
jgi:uncharacterized pyridoxal phosphate-containing UPF0001 family protein